MPTTPITHFVFVDFENVQAVDLDLIEGKPVQVILLVGKNQGKIAYELVEQIHRRATQVRLEKLTGAGHNALDLTLAYYLGRAIERAPEAHFAIVSKDKDFEPMIAHVVAQGIQVKRHDSFATLPFLPQPKPAKPRPAKAPRSGKGNPVPAAPVLPKDPPADDRFERLITRLRNNQAPRPKKRASLLARIKTDFGNKLTDLEAEEKLGQLIDLNVVEIDQAGKVMYR
jgi:hypothetical protein